MHGNQKTHQGFTLIELMIVVTIIGVLASIAVPVYRDYTIRARVSETATMYAPVKTAISLYYSETGNLPDSLADLAAVSNNPFAYSGDYVWYLFITPPGEVSVGLHDGPELGSAALGEVIFTPVTTSQSIDWSVSGIGVEDKYLPIIN